MQTLPHLCGILQAGRSAYRRGADRAAGIGKAQRFIRCGSAQNGEDEAGNENLMMTIMQDMFYDGE